MVRPDNPATRAHRLTQTAPQAAIVVDHDDPAPRMLPDEEDTEPARRRWPIVTSLFVLLIVLVVGGGYLGWRYTQDQYYVGTGGTNVAVFQGINQSVAGVRLSHVYRRTNIPLAGVPSPDLGQIRATVPATSRSNALAIVANIRKDYQNCVAAHTAMSKYNTDFAQYKAAKAAYQKKYGSLKVQHSSKGRVTARPPQFTETQPTIPGGCPAPPATGGSP
jgi:hypothetical protein